MCLEIISKFPNKKKEREKTTIKKKTENSKSKHRNLEWPEEFTPQVWAGTGRRHLQSPGGEGGCRWAG